MYKSVAYICWILILTSIFIAGVGFFFLEHGAYDFSMLTRDTRGFPTIVYDETGREIARFHKDIRNDASYAHIPEHVIHAFLAAEDHTFFRHRGISIPSIIRSTIKNIYYRRIVQGASTITQQLIKIAYFNGERSFTRKIKEQVLALFVERRFTKEQILHAYLNNIYLGCGMYGIHSASMRLWNKEVDELTLDEAASLAAIVQSPATYCPLRDSHRNQDRRDLILKRMYDLGYISQSEYTDAIQESITLNESSDSTSVFPYITELLRGKLEATIGHRALYHGGYVVQTTINASMQDKAERTFRHHIKQYRKKRDHVDGGLVTLDSMTGSIRVMIGGYAFSESQFNRATQARRQMGSIFKPFVYAQAISNGFRFSDVEVDEPITISDSWTPRNVHRRHEGAMTYARALIHSNNVIAVKLLLSVGADKIEHFARTCGLHIPHENYPSLALGCTDATVMETAAAFNVFANHGTYVKPHLISWIKDNNGNKVWNHTPEREHVLSWNTCSQVTHVLRHVMEHLRHRMPKLWIPGETIGKTGTTNDARTCWFVGSTPDLTTALYIGRDDNASMAGTMTSVYNALPLWLACNKHWARDDATFYVDPHLMPRYINAVTGQTVSYHHPQAISVYEPAYDHTAAS